MPAKAIMARGVETLKRNVSARLVLKLVIILTAAALIIFPLPADRVERVYSEGFYPSLQSAVTPVTNHIPFAVVDLLVAALVLGLPAWWAVGLVKAGRGRRGRRAALLLLNTLVAAAVATLAFLLLWGFNYQRKPLAAKLDYDESRLSADRIKQLKRLAAEQLNATVGQARDDTWPADAEWLARLHSSFDQTLIEMGRRRGIAQAVAKTSALNFYLEAAGIEGFVNPFGYEVVLDKELLRFEKPFALAHEWAHLAGYADESEASFVGLLACLRSDLVAVRYSGWLALYQHTPWPASGAEGEAGEAMRRDPPPGLAPEVLADLRAISERINRRVSPAVSGAQWKMYDSFLKANRVEAGVASYGLVLRLVAATRFEDGWVPARRPGP